MPEAQSSCLACRAGCLADFMTGCTSSVLRRLQLYDYMLRLLLLLLLLLVTRSRNQHLNSLAVQSTNFLPSQSRTLLARRRYQQERTCT